jgi:hypothetical protein
MRRLDDESKWFIIDWEDAATLPTKAEPRFNSSTHSPSIFVDGHGAEVDIWGVGGLILDCSVGYIIGATKLGHADAERNSPPLPNGLTNHA